MSASKSLVFAVASAIGAVALVFTPSTAQADAKFSSGVECVPYGPDTTAAELQITPNGIYNFGTTVEKVLCPIPRDAEAEYAGGSIEVLVYYRVLGALPARMTCTLYIGSAAVQTTSIITTTASGSFVSNGAVTSVWLISGGAMDPDRGPNNVLCSMPAKSQLGGVHLQEDGATDPPAA